MRVTKDLYPEYSSVFTAKPSDPKQRLLYMFDNALVLPEYIVEFEYEYKHHAKTIAATLCWIVSSLVSAVVPYRIVGVSGVVLAERDAQPTAHAR